MAAASHDFTPGAPNAIDTPIATREDERVDELIASASRKRDVFGVQREEIGRCAHFKTRANAHGLRPAPQGRGYRIRKRSNHVTVIIDSIANKTAVATAEVAEETAE